MMITPLGWGGILPYIQRKTQITWSRLIGIVLFRTGLTLWGLALLLIPATLAMYHYGLTEKVNLNLWVWWFFLLVPGLFWMIEAWLFWHHKIEFRISKVVVRNRESEFWTAFNRATRS